MQHRYILFPNFLSTIIHWFLPTSQMEWILYHLYLRWSSCLCKTYILIWAVIFHYYHTSTELPPVLNKFISINHFLQNYASSTILLTLSAQFIFFTNPYFGQNVYKACTAQCLCLLVKQIYLHTRSSSNVYVKKCSYKSI